MERILGKQFWEHILGNVFLQKNFIILETTYSCKAVL